MNAKTLIAALTLPLAAATTAHADEQAIRQGKNLETITGQAGAPLAFTFEGAATDIALMRLSDGSVFFWATLSELSRGLSHAGYEKIPQQQGPVAGPLKPALVDFKFAATSAAFRGARIELYRNGVLVDSDRVLLK